MSSPTPAPTHGTKVSTITLDMFTLAGSSTNPVFSRVDRGDQNLGTLLGEMKQRLQNLKSGDLRGSCNIKESEDVVSPKSVPLSACDLGTSC